MSKKDGIGAVFRSLTKKSPRGSLGKAESSREAKLGFLQRNSSGRSDKSPRGSSEGSSDPNSTPTLGARRKRFPKIVEKETKEKPFERIQREDSLLYGCVSSLGIGRAVFVELIDHLHAIFREKAISYLDNPVIASLKSKIPQLLRPCDILFKQREQLLVKDRITDVDIQALIQVKEALGDICKKLPETIPDILENILLTEQAEKQLKELDNVVLQLYREYEKAINTLIGEKCEERRELLISTPHMKSPHLAFPVKITRETYHLMNSLDANGQPFKSNQTGEHLVSNARVKVPAGHEEAFVQRFVIPQNDTLPELKENPKGKTQRGDERELRLFFKPNFPINNSRVAQIMPAAERVNGFAIRVQDAHAAPSTWVITDEGVRWRDKEGEPDLVELDTDASDRLEHEKDFVDRNAVQIGLGAQGYAIEDIEILNFFIQMLLEKKDEKTFFTSLDILLDINSCMVSFKSEECFKPLIELYDMGSITTDEQLQRVLPIFAGAFKHILKDMNQDTLPREASAFFDENKSYCYNLIKGWLKEGRKTRDIIHFIAQIKAAPRLFEKESLQDMLEFCEKLPIIRYYFPGAPLKDLPEKMKNIYLFSSQTYHNWYKASMYGFNDLTGGNVHIEPFRRDLKTGDTTEALPVDIDHAEGPIGEAYYTSKQQKRRRPSDNEWEEYEHRNYFIGILSAVQVMSHMQGEIPQDCIERDEARPEHEVYQNFLACLEGDRDVYQRAILRGHLLPSDSKCQVQSKKAGVMIMKQRLDYNMLFHLDLLLGFFRRGKVSLETFKSRHVKTYWDHFGKIFPLAQPVYKQLLKRHDGNLLFVLKDLKRGLSISDVLGEELPHKYRAQLESSQYTPHSHIEGRHSSIDELTFAVHEKQFDPKSYKVETLIDVIDDIGKHLPSLKVIPAITEKDIELLEEIIQLSARSARADALRLALQTHQSFEGCDTENIARIALSTLIHNRTRSKELNVLSTLDVLLKFVSVPNTRVEELQSRIETNCWQDVYSPIIELSQDNQKFSGVTRLMLMKLLKAGFDPEARDQFGKSGIDIAVFEGSVEMFCALVNGASKRESGLLNGRRRSSSGGSKNRVGSWKFLDEVRVVDFIELHRNKIPDNVLSKIMRNSRVAGELIRRRIFVENSGSAIPVKSLVDGDVYLPIEFVEQFVDKFSFFFKAKKQAREQRHEEKKGTRPVVSVNYHDTKMHVKVGSEFPVFELWAQHVVHDLIGFGTSVSHSVQFDRVSLDALIKYYERQGGNQLRIQALKQLKRSGRSIRVLISNTVEGVNCEDVLKRNNGNMRADGEVYTEEQLFNFMLFTFVMIIMVFRDAKPDNIIQALDSFCLIDSGINSLEPFKNDKLKFLCVQFCQDEMYVDLFINAMFQVLSVKSDEFLGKAFDYFVELVEKHKDHFGSSPEIPKELSPDWVLKFRDRLHNIQTALKKAVERTIEEDEPMNLMEVLQRTLPNVRHAYRDAHAEVTVYDRFIKATQTKLSQLLHRVAGTKEQTFAVAMTQKVKTSAVGTALQGNKAQYDPANASTDFKQAVLSEVELDRIARAFETGDKKPFLSLHLKSGKDTVPLDGLREKVVNKINFQGLPEERQLYIIKVLISKEGKVNFKKLQLRFCTVLKKNVLNKLLGNCSELQTLDLYGCSGLTTSSLELKSVLKTIAETAPNLIHLNLGASSVKKVEFRNQHLTSLKYLYVKDCPDLESVTCKSTELRHLSLENNPKLRKVDFRSKVLSVLNLKGCNLPLNVLQKVLSLASKLSRFTFEPVEEYSPRELAWFVFGGWHPAISQLSEEHRVTRHTLPLMLGKDGSLQLGGLPVSETDLGNIAALLSSPERQKDPIPCKTLDLRGVMANHRAQLRRLCAGMVMGKSSLEKIICQPKLRPKLNTEPFVYIEPQFSIQDIIMAPQGQLVLSTDYKWLYLVDTSQIESDDSRAKTFIQEDKKIEWDSEASPLILTPEGQLVSVRSHKMFLWSFDDLSKPIKSKETSSVADHYGAGSGEFYPVYSMIPFNENVFIAVTKVSISQSYHYSSLNLTYDAGSSKSSLAVPVFHNILILPNLDVVYVSKKMNNEMLVFDHQKEEWLPIKLETKTPSFLLLTNRNTLLSFSDDKIIEWDYERLMPLREYENPEKRKIRFVRQCPNGEFLVIYVDLAIKKTVLALYDSEFNEIMMLANKVVGRVSLQIDACGNIFFVSKEGRSSYALRCVQTQSVSLTAKNILSIIETYQPLVVENSIFLQAALSNENIEETIGVLEALFECKIEVLGEGNQAGTIKLDFKDEAAAYECYQYLYSLKNESVSDKVVNPQTKIDASGMDLSASDIVWLATHSPFVKNISGVNADVLSLEDLTQILSTCGSLSRLRDLDLSFREVMPKIVDQNPDETSVILYFSKYISEERIEAWSACCKLLSGLADVKVERTNDFEYTLTADNAETLSRCISFISSLSSTGEQLQSKITCLTKPNQDIQASRNLRSRIGRNDGSRQDQRRSSISEYEEIGNSKQFV